MKILLALLLVACGGAQSARPRPTTGAIMGLARDSASGEPISLAEVSVGRIVTTSNQQGMYALDHVAPGRHTVHAKFAGQPVTINNVGVVAGEAMLVDINFTLGSVEPIVVDFGDPSQGAIQRFRPKGEQSLIEGTVLDAGSRVIVAGAVVTAVDEKTGETLQTVSDDRGRYRFEPIAAGTYAVSAYYSIGGRGQIEVRRGEITVDRAERVVVPLWIELTKQ